MTARTVDPDTVLADAGHELLTALAALLDEHPDLTAAPGDVAELLDRLTVALRRARGRVRRAEKASTGCDKSGNDIRPNVTPDVKPEPAGVTSPAGTASARPVLIEVLRPAPKPVGASDPLPGYDPAPDSTRTGECAGAGARDTHGDRQPPEGNTMTQPYQPPGWQPPSSPPTPTPSPPASRRPWLIAAAAVLVLIVGIAVFFALRGGSFTVHGTLTLPASGVSHNGQGCYGKGGYDDIRPGAAVTVYDGAGKVIGAGQVDRGKAPEGASLACVFEFTVPGVPAGRDFYQIEVTHRGKVTYPADQVRDGVSLTLG